jgi:hypothetical protein
MGSEPLSAEDAALLERVARRVVDLHRELPAILTLETGKPLSLVASQTLVFFEPIVQAMVSIPDYRRFALLVERREAVEAMIRSIERIADEARAARRGAGGGAPRPPAA